MILRWIMFGEIVGQIIFSKFPKKIVISLANSILYTKNLISMALVSFNVLCC